MINLAGIVMTHLHNEMISQGQRQPQGFPRRDVGVARCVPRQFAEYACCGDDCRSGRRKHFTYSRGDGDLPSFINAYRVTSIVLILT